MQRLAVVLLLLSSFLWAETQEEAYFRAMKAEEAGDVSAAVKAFEAAVALPGPYTEELKEILKSYYEALGVNEDGEPGSLSFRVQGEIGFNGLNYDEAKVSENVDEYGGDAFANVSAFVDYSVGDWNHSFGVNLSGDWFLMNDNMPALDTSDWTLSIGAEYLLMGKSVLINVGLDLDLAEDADPSGTVYGWGMKELYRYGKNRVGAALWAYYDFDGPLSSAVYATWNRTASYGWNGSAYLGVRFEADSIFNYKEYVSSYGKAFEKAVDEVLKRPGKDPFDYCLEKYNAKCFDWSFDTIDSLYEEYVMNEAEQLVDVPLLRYYGKWIGPALRAKLSYRFKTNISVEAKLNMFYGFVVDGPDSDYERIQKFSATWGGMVYWKPDFGQFYLGLEQIYRHYDLPKYYKDVYSKSSSLTEIKAGFKWEL